MTNVFAQVIYLAADEEPSGISLVLPDMAELIGGIIAFIIVFGFIWWKGGPAIKRSLEARQAAIGSQLTAAEDAKKEAEGLLDDYKQQVANAREEGARIIDEARQSADALRQEIEAKARADAEAIVAKAREDAAAERERVTAGLRDEVASLSLDVAQRVVAGSVDSKAQKKLVDQYLTELEGIKN